jgi:hypothetical protein
MERSNVKNNKGAEVKIRIGCLQIISKISGKLEGIVYFNDTFKVFVAKIYRFLSI